MKRRVNENDHEFYKCMKEKGENMEFCKDFLSIDSTKARMKYAIET